MPLMVKSGGQDSLDAHELWHGRSVGSAVRSQRGA